MSIWVLLGQDSVVFGGSFQAVRRMEGGSLSEEEVERVGLALMKLEEKVHQLAEHFGLKPADLNINLGPLGDLL